MRMGLRSAVVAVLLVLGVSAWVHAGLKTESVTVRGMVEVVMDESGEAVEEINLYDDEGVAYGIALDKKGLELKEMDGETVVVKGTLSEDGVITVTSFEKAQTE